MAQGYFGSGELPQVRCVQTQFRPSYSKVAVWVLLPGAAAAGTEVRAGRCDPVGGGLQDGDDPRAAELAARGDDFRFHLFAGDRPGDEEDVALVAGDGIAVQGHVRDREAEAAAHGGPAARGSGAAGGIGSIHRSIIRFRLRVPGPRGARSSLRVWFRRGMPVPLGVLVRLRALPPSPPVSGLAAIGSLVSFLSHAGPDCNRSDRRLPQSGGGGEGITSAGLFRSRPK